MEVLENTRVAERLRTNIDGVWTAYEFSQFFGAISDLYILFGTPIEPPNVPVALEDAKSGNVLRKILLTSSPPLKVNQVRFSSPGFTDFAGAAQAIGHLKDFLLALMRFKADQRKASAEASKLEAEAKKILADAEKTDSEAQKTRYESALLNFEASKRLAEARKLDAEAALIEAQAEKLADETIAGKLRRLSELGYDSEQLKRIQFAALQQHTVLREAIESDRLVGINDKREA